MTREPARREWSWCSRKRRCLELFVAGISRRQIAIEIGVHRNTINRWCSHPELLAEARHMMDEHAVTTRIRRLRETNLFADRVARLARSHLAEVEQHPHDEAASRRARDFMREFRSWRDHERKDLGEPDQPVWSGRLGAATPRTATMDLREFLVESIETGLIDAEHAADSCQGDPLLMVADLVLQALANTTIAAQLDAEDATAAEQ